MLHSRDETALTLAQPDRAIPRMDGQRLAAAIHLAVDLRVAEGSFHRHGYPQADMAIAGTGVNVRLKVRREHQVHATVARANRPACSHLGTRQNAGIHASVARFHIQRVESSSDTDMPVARIGLHLAIEFMRLNWAVSCPQAYITFEVLNGNAAITGVQIDRAAQRIGLHRAIAGMHVYRPADGFSLYGTVAGFHL